MSGKKTKKVKKAATRHVTAQQLEKDFLQTPSKVSAQLNKEMAVLKQQDNKSKSALDKLHLQADKAKSNAAKKAIAKKLKTATAECQATAKLLAQATVKQAKMTALRKQLSQFEKDWNKQAKDLLLKATAKAMPKPKAAAKPKPKKAPKAKAANYMKPATMQPSAKSYDTSLEEVRQEEAAELTS